MKKVGVILARFQPIHNGHLELIKQAVQENSEVLIVIGSADKLNERNPIPYQVRYKLVCGAIDEMNLPAEKKAAIKIVGLDDLTTETDDSHEWGFYLYSNIVKEIGQSNFTMYYSDGWEIITSWFPGFILRNFVSLKLLARNSYEKGISATEVRKMLVANRPDISQYVPNVVCECRDALKTYIELSLKYSR